MDLKIGDFVRFVDEDLEGTITSFQNNGFVGVTDTEGFELPVPASKVTLVYGQRDKEAEDEIADRKKRPDIVDFVRDGVYLAITGEGQQGLAELYLVNDTSYQLLVSLSTQQGAALQGELSALIHPLSCKKVYAANMASIGSWPVFIWQLMFFTEQNQAIKPPLMVNKRIRPADLSTAKKQVGQLGKKAWMFQLDEPAPFLETGKLKEHFLSHRPPRNK